MRYCDILSIGSHSKMYFSNIPPFPDKFNIRNYIFIQCFIGTFFFQRPINYQLFINSMQINKPKTLLFK